MDIANESHQPGAAQHGCQFEQTLKGEPCEHPEEVSFGGLLLCERHAWQLKAQERTVLWRGIASSLEVCLRNVNLWRDADLVRRLQAEQARATAEFELAQEELQRIRLR